MLHFPLAYYEFSKLFQHYAYDPTLQEIAKKRFKFVFTDSMGIAYMLTPRFASEGFYFDDNKFEIMSSVEKFVEKRRPELAQQARSEIISFVTKMSSLPEHKKDFIYDMTARQYWVIFGQNEFPALYVAAKPINEMVCSSAASERIWSIYKFIHSRLRNRLSNEKVEKLVALYVNCAILDKNDFNDYIMEQEGAVLDGNDC